MTLNLISGAWIPVRRRDGTRAVIRPAQIVEELDGNCIAFPDWPRPDLNIATLELLIGLLSVARPPEDDDEWLRVWNKPPTVAELDKAFAPYECAFNVDGDGPRFCQDFDALEGETLPVERLFLDSSSENAERQNSDLMVKRERYRLLSRASAAIALYANLAFVYSTAAGQKHSHRASLRGAGPMSTFVLPPAAASPERCLWGIVWANVREETCAVVSSDLSKVFPWMARTYVSSAGDIVHEADPRVHRQQVYFGMPRRIRLCFQPNVGKRPCDLTGSIDEVIVTSNLISPDGIKYGNWRHPLSPYKQGKNNDNWSAVHPQAGRIGYDSWIAITIGDKENKTNVSPEVVQKFRQRLHGAPGEFCSSRANTLIAGWAMKKAKNLDYTLAEQPLYVLDDGAAQNKFDDFARKMVLAAESVNKALIKAIQAALKAGKDAPKIDSALITSAREGFFVDTDSDFHNILASAAAKSGIDDAWQAAFAEDWLRKMQRAAFKGFDTAVQPDPSDIKRARIVVAARDLLRRALSGRPLRTSLGLAIAIKPKKTKQEGTS